MKKVLLLNPPGDKRYFRDYYCTKVSKADYYYHPVDLVYLSGILNECYEVYVIDAIAEEYSDEECLKKIKKIKPNIILSLVASPSFPLDINFLKKVKKENPNTVIAITGDVSRELKKEILIKYLFLDAVLLDFSTNDFIKYIVRKSNIIVDNIIYRDDDAIFEGKEIHGYGEFNIPIPRWDLFNLDAYSFPFSRRKPVATILTDFGCPFNCSFCPISTLGFKLRDLDGVLDEMSILKNLGVNELFFRDQTFGVDKKRTLKLCKGMIKERFKFGWTCFSRVDVLDKEILDVMKKSGCHTIMFGVETADEEQLKKYNKNIKLKGIEETIRLARQIGIRTVGTFIIGLPGDSRDSILKTIEFSKKIKLDFASFNIATPRFGTELRKDSVKKGWIDDTIMTLDSSNSKPVWKDQDVSNDELVELKNYANRAFYLRPNYVLRRIIGLRTVEELKSYIKEGTKLLVKTFKK